VIEADDAEGVAGPCGIGETGVAEKFDHAGWTGEAVDRGVEVAVCGCIAGDETAEFRQNGFEVEVVNCAGEAFGLVALEDTELAAGAEDTEDFGEGLFVVGEIAEAEGGGDEVDGGVAKREMKGIGFDGEDVSAGKFFLSQGEHLVGEVDREDGSGMGCVGAMLEQGHRHVAGAAAEIEGDGLGVLEDGTEEAGGAVPPPAVDAGGEEMVGAVVGGGDGVEHLLDVRGGRFLIGRADGASAGGEFVFGKGIQSAS